MTVAERKREMAKVEMIRRTKARRHFTDYMGYMHPDLSLDPFHKTYYDILDLFAHGVIRKLIITCPPQHGKSEGSTRNLPAYMHGLNPDLQICITSYGFPLAQKFNRAVQANIATAKYEHLFPDTVLPKTPKAQQFKGKMDLTKFPRNSREYSLVGSDGGLIAVGRGGALTGNPVDIGIIDDLYKDDVEANSPVVRAAAVDWYVDVFSTRLHNNSQQLITFTRWHEDDLIGYLRGVNEAHGTPFIEITDLDMFRDSDFDPSRWYIINFEAIRETGEPCPVDPREKGDLLWPEKHGLEKLLEQRKLDPGRFQSLYQGNPMPREGLLYPNLQTYAKFPGSSMLRGVYMYVDVADEGEDRLCGIVYGHSRRSDTCLVKDIVYSDEGVEITEEMVANAIIRNRVKVAWIESNNGGAAFAKHVEHILKKKHYTECTVCWFHQGLNKESRILTHASDVMRMIRLPDDWGYRWPEFFKDVKGFKRLFRANRHDDGPDALTGVVETAIEGRFIDALYKR